MSSPSYHVIKPTEESLHVIQTVEFWDSLEGIEKAIKESSVELYEDIAKDTDIPNAFPIKSKFQKSYGSVDDVLKTIDNPTQQYSNFFILYGYSASFRRGCEVDCTPLSYAVRNARINVIEMLLNRGGDVQKGQLLQYAVCRDEELEDVISLLIDRGAPLNATMYQDGPTWMRFYPMSLGTALHIATEQEDSNAIRLLIRRGADTGVKDANGDTALDCAQKWNKTEMVKLLGDLEDRL
ncbi:uncharacterized protein N7479_011136 [Penicillium vulpinum]|uniref:Uncharacterized protein n=1 Tax=Penicillium vulpinum TaxID=29845 RepID=A0A1V6RRI0_9EURO|nr:uncharacterized protein N7479_011136 [Penicillium vulpinum]KAJ5952723.1 hypothetical protein N7479_011136 [Penicillium vulpinum]OQE04381.1 hypothetical protein PENVUL_c033G05340 [Penicillium vulpinum]